jgi:hypothetical protein
MNSSAPIHGFVALDSFSISVVTPVPAAPVKNNAETPEALVFILRLEFEVKGAALVAAKEALSFVPAVLNVLV